MFAHDYHAHTTYSDGSFLRFMLAAAEDVGLDDVGLADHCNVSERPAQRRRRLHGGYNLDRTYERRREAIDSLRGEFDVTVHDAVEMDYDPADEAAIGAFLADAGFDYAVGSVHLVDGTNVHYAEYFEAMSPADRRAAVDEYFRKVVAMVESDLFEVAGHLDLVERNPALRGLATRDHYEAVAAALADSRTVPEVNAGRALADYGEFHPAPEFLSVLRDHGVGVTLGTDAHAPDQLRERARALAEFVAETGLEPVAVH